MTADGNLALSAATVAPAGYFTAHSIEPVERRARLSEEEFRWRYLLPRRPVVFTDLAEPWPVHGRGTPDYFRSRYGTHAAVPLSRNGSPAADMKSHV